MNRYKLSKAGVNATQGIARLAGDTELYASMLCRFPEEEQYADLVRAIENQDVQAAFAAAHALKGIAGNMSMNRLFQDICPLVEKLRAGQLDGVQELLAPVSADYAAIIAAVGDAL